MPSNYKTQHAGKYKYPLNSVHKLGYLQLNGKSICWEHIKQLYYIATETTGLSTVHKLKYEHIFLSGFSKMRVDYAAQVNQTTINNYCDHYNLLMCKQVLSQSVATALRVHVKEAEETANFAEMFDKYFDLLNVTNYTKCITKQKKFQQPYRWANDARLVVILLN